MLDTLFSFPVVVVDGDMYERNQRMSSLTGKETEEDPEIVIITQDVPFEDFVSISDRWLPTNDSYQKALVGDFDACYVLFERSGAFLVPWKKDKFKKLFSEFVQKWHNDNPDFMKIYENK